MAKKYHYYILVFSSTGAVYVTSIDKSNKYAHWDKRLAPKEFPASVAEDLVFGLNCNFINAVLVKSPREIDTQPYNYDFYDCVFVERGGNKDGENN